MRFKMEAKSNQVEILSVDNDNMNYDMTFFELYFSDNEYRMMSLDTGEIIIQFNDEDIIYIDNDYYIEIEV